MTAETHGERLERANRAGAELVAAQQGAGALDRARKLLAEWLAGWPQVDGVSSQPDTVAGVRVQRFHRDAGEGTGTVVYAHGGGFRAGTGVDAGAFLGLLASETGMEVLACEYRLAPEDPFPAGLDDVDAVLQATLRRADGPVVAVGDSAGGNLVAAATLRAVGRGDPLPAALVLLSPLLDLTPTADSYRSNADSDGMISEPGVAAMAELYLAGAPATAPEASPLHAESLVGFPPTALYASSTETLRDDSVRFAVRLAEAGGEVRLAVEHGLPHGWIVQGGALQEARRTIDDAAAFLRGIAERGIVGCGPIS